jgi:hypothetical protein
MYETSELPSCAQSREFSKTSSSRCNGNSPFKPASHLTHSPPLSSILPFIIIFLSQKQIFFRVEHYFDKLSSEFFIVSLKNSQLYFDSSLAYISTILLPIPRIFVGLNLIWYTNYQEVRGLLTLFPITRNDIKEAVYFGCFSGSPLLLLSLACLILSINLI